MNPRASSVLITGGGRGLGRAIATVLAERGAFVGIVARTPAEVEAAADEINALGGRAWGACCDVLDRALLASVVARFVEQAEGLDALVCSAGGLAAIGPMATADPDIWWNDVETAVRGTHNAVCVSMPALSQSARASIAVLVGPGHHLALPFASGYGCAQAALVRLVESLADELSADRVMIHAVNPGLVPTRLIRGLTDTREGRRWLPRFNEALAEGKEVDASVAAEMVSWLLDARPAELNGRVVAAAITPAILESRLRRVESENLGVLRLR